MTLALNPMDSIIGPTRIIINHMGETTMLDPIRPVLSTTQVIIDCMVSGNIFK